jgi:hypothetical protein
VSTWMLLQWYCKVLAIACIAEPDIDVLGTLDRQSLRLYISMMTSVEKKGVIFTRCLCYEAEYEEE